MTCYISSETIPALKYKMYLTFNYDPKNDALTLASGESRRASVLLESGGHAVIDLPDEESYVAVGLEVFGISAYLPLGKRGYSETKDVLTIGDDVASATLIAENDDLIAYWRSDESDPQDMAPIGLGLRNASKHLAPLMSDLRYSPDAGKVL